MNPKIRNFLEKLAASDDESREDLQKQAALLLLIGDDDGTTPNPDEALRFVELAADGHHPAASSGERAAARLAIAIADVGLNFVNLDTSAIRGAAVLMQLAKGPWPTDKERSLALDLMRRAARRAPTL